MIPTVQHLQPQPNWETLNCAIDNVRHPESIRRRGWRLPGKPILPSRGTWQGTGKGRVTPVGEEEDTEVQAQVQG